MKVYFLETNADNVVVIAEGRSAKIYEAAPSGIYAGVDLYSNDAAKQLRDKFTDLDEAGDLNGFDEMSGEEIEIDNNLFDKLAGAELVFSDGEGIQIWSVEPSQDPTDDFFCGTEEECREYCRENSYSIGEGWQIARISVDDNFRHSLTEEIIDE